MSNDPTPHFENLSDDDSTKELLDQILAECMQRAERGEPVDREQLFGQYPNLVPELKKHFDNEDRLNRVVNEQPHVSSTVEYSRNEQQEGALIAGRYKLIENIGEGGMGSVWLADQKEPVKRKVALKLIKPGMDSRQVLARFEAERQALALMDHPNIAKVLDGGLTEQGRPYFVMEYVKGIPFTEYCDDARLSLQQRLELFIPVCQAVQHAHHKGIVHRDLKPSNILICLYDGKPVPKVIDFGLAKAMNQQLTEQSIYTGHGVMVGTPVYMSPEQAELNNLDIDTRTDIYSLGVVLYELLTGTTPLEREQLRAAAYNEVLRLIKEVEPPRPSTRLSGSASLPSVAAQRNIDPRSLQKTLTGDLDWIVMKSLEKERTRRYETATSLQRDIERFLHDEPVEACPPSKMYRLKKYIHKHRTQAIASSVIMSALLLSIAAFAWGWRQASDAATTVSRSLAEVTQERDAKNEALEAKSAALTAESAAKDLAERKMIEGILRPIGYGDEPSSVELRAFADWAALSRNQLKLKVLEVAFENPQAALRVAFRSPRVIQACVGISSNRRTAACELLRRHLSPNASAETRVAARWILMELGNFESSAITECLTWLRQPDSKNQTCHPSFSEFLYFLRHRFQLLTNEQVILTWDGLIAGLSNVNDKYVVDEICFAIAELAPKLDSKHLANQDWTPIIQSIFARTSDSYSENDPSEAAASAIVRQLDQRQIWEHWLRISEQHGAETHNERIRSNRFALGLLTAKLDPSIIRDCWGSQIAKLQTEDNPRAIAAIEEILWNLAVRLKEEDAEFAVQSIAGGLLENEINSDVRRITQRLLAVLAPIVEGRHFVLTVNALIELFDSRDSISTASSTLEEVAPRLNLQQSTKCWEKLMSALEITTDKEEYQAIVAASHSMPQYLEASQIDRMWNAHIKLIANGVRQRPSNPPSYHREFRTLVREELDVLSKKLETSQVESMFQRFVKSVESSYDGPTRKSVSEELVAIAPRLAQAQVDYVSRGLIDLVEGAGDPGAVESHALPLAALGGKLKPEEYRRAWLALCNVDQRWSLYDPREAAAEALAKLAKHVSTFENFSCWEPLVQLLERTGDTDYFVQQHLESAFSELISGLEPSQVTPSWDRMLEAFHRAQSSSVQQRMWNTLQLLAAKTSSQQSVRSISELLDVLRGMKEKPRRIDLTIQVVKQFGDIDSDRSSSQIVHLLLNMDAMRETYFREFHASNFVRHNFLILKPPVAAITNPRTVANFFLHPSCCGEPREFLLQRFEELVMHDGRHVLLQLASDPNKEGSDSLSLVEQGHARRFRTLHDAAAWIEQNWPDFDLNATMPVTWLREQ